MFIYMPQKITMWKLKATNDTHLIGKKEKRKKVNTTMH
jgi:hypothetical protein